MACAGQPSILCLPVDHAPAHARVPLSRHCAALGLAFQRQLRPLRVSAPLVCGHAGECETRVVAGWYSLSTLVVWQDNLLGQQAAFAITLGLAQHFYICSVH